MRFVLATGAMLLSVNVFAQTTAPARAPAPTRPAATASAPSQAYDDAIARARALLKDDKAKEALAVSEEAIASNDKRWEAYVTAASAYSVLTLYDDAMGMLQAALIRAPEDRKPMLRDALTETRRALAAPLPSPAGATPGPATAQTATQAEIVLWKSIEASTNPNDFKGYLTAYPNGVYAPVATTRIEALAELGKSPQEKATDLLNKIRAFADGAKSGSITQNVFAAGCVLSIVRTGSGGRNANLATTDPAALGVSTDARGVWFIQGLKIANSVYETDIWARDQAAASQLFSLLPQTIQACKGTAAGAAAAAEDLIRQVEQQQRPAAPAARGSR